MHGDVVGGMQDCKDGASRSASYWLAAHVVTENHAHSRGQACDSQSPAGTHRTCLLSVWCMCTLLHVSAFLWSGDAVQEYRCLLYCFWSSLQKCIWVHIAALIAQQLSVIAAKH